MDTPAGVHDLFIENLTPAQLAAWIRISDQNGRPVVDGRFELPDERGIRFDAIAAWETTYTIDLAVDNTPTRSTHWYTALCPGQDGKTQQGSRNASIRITAPPDTTDLELDFVRDQCDAINSPTVPIGPAETFRLK